MLYDYTVKVNGEYYPAGTDVPENIEESSMFSDEEIVLETEPVKIGRPKKS